MAILLKTVSVRVSSIQIMQVRVQNKGKSVWKSRYDGDVSLTKHIHVHNQRDINMHKGSEHMIFHQINQLASTTRSNQHY